MTLIVEDGTGLATAESYVSVAYCDAYAAANGKTAWTGTDAAKEVALRKATQYLDSVYCWKSSPINPFVQALQWPRVGYLWSWPEIKKLKSACCELAVRAIASDLFADVDAQHVTDVQVGPIKRSLSAPANGGQKRYAAVDALVRSLVRGSGGIEVVRA